MSVYPLQAIFCVVGVELVQLINPGFGAVGAGSAYAAARKLCACPTDEKNQDQIGEKKNPWGTVY